MLRKLMFVTALQVAVASPALAVPKYFIRVIHTLEECRGEYRSLTGKLPEQPGFARARLPGGREHVLNCLPDGVEEFVCNPASGRLVVAIEVGSTEWSCRAYTPDLPIRPAILAK